MIAETGLMSYIAITSVQITNSNVTVMGGAYLVHTNVMAIRIVPMDQTRPMRFAIIGNVIKKRNFHVTMENVYLFYGGVISIMIVEMIVTSQLISAETTTVLLVGVVAQVMQIIVVYRNGCSVMEKMIVGMVPMSLQKIVHPVKKREISNVKIEDAFPSDGYVTLKMTAEIIQTSKKICVLTKGIENVLNLSTGAITLNVSQLDGNVTMMTIVGMGLMNVIALTTPVLQKDSNAIVDTV
jgi:hypothetical protein